MAKEKIKKVTYSKNEKAEEILGKRNRGIPIQEPCELDYACPICSKPINEKTKIFDAKGDIKPEYLRLEFSEYNGFMWCSQCNIDIPSFLCLSPKSKEAVEIYTERFLHFMNEFKERIYKPLNDDEKDSQKMRIKIIDLESEIKRLTHRSDLNSVIKSSFSQSKGDNKK